MTLFSITQIVKNRGNSQSMFPVVVMDCMWYLHRTQSTQSTETVKNFWFLLPTLSSGLLGSRCSPWTPDPQSQGRKIEILESEAQIHASSVMLFMLNVWSQQCDVTQTAPGAIGPLPVTAYAVNHEAPKVLHPRPLHSPGKMTLPDSVL